jgi:hypothetical protein
VLSNLPKPACTAHVAEILSNRPRTATAPLCAWRQQMGKRKKFVGRGGAEGRGRRQWRIFFFF